MIHFEKITKNLYEYIKNKFAEDPKFKKYTIFYKIKNKDDCLSDYIVYTLDCNSNIANFCKDFKDSFTLRAILVGNPKSAFNNLELISFIVLILKEYRELEPQLISYTDSIVSEVCTNLITDLRIDFKIKINNYS